VRKTLPKFGLLIDHPAGNILVDTGSHPDAGDGHWPEWLFDASEHIDAHERTLSRELESLGYGLDEVDYVVRPTSTSTTPAGCTTSPGPTCPSSFTRRNYSSRGSTPVVRTAVPDTYVAISTTT
jgi:hypothetical protein